MLFKHQLTPLQIAVTHKLLEQMLATFSFFNLGNNLLSQLEPYMTDLFAYMARMRLQSEVTMCRCHLCGS